MFLKVTCFTSVSGLSLAMSKREKLIALRTIKAINFSRFDIAKLRS